MPEFHTSLSVLELTVPQLKARLADLSRLVAHFLHGIPVEPEALDVLMAYHWPGNVRELENVIERAVVLATGRSIGPDLIPDHVGQPSAFQIPRFVVPPEGTSFKDFITDVEKRLIESTLEAAGGVQKRAAELLHIKPTTLNEMIKRYEIRPRGHYFLHRDLAVLGNVQFEPGILQIRPDQYDVVFRIFGN